MIGYTRPVAVGFVTQDTKTNIITFLQLFKTCHPEENLNRTKIIFVDKDQKEISAIGQELASSIILLCWFHVLKSFKTHIAEWDEP